jgi:hypothetical protein
MIAAGLVNLVLLVVFGTTAFFVWRQGLWGGIVMLCNLLVAATAATWGHRALAAWLEGWMPTYRYLLDMLAVGGIFAAVLAVTREITDRVSRTRVRFPFAVELVGRSLLAAACGWVAMAFTAAALHTAPVPRSVVPVASGMLLGLAPDRAWLRWAVNAAGRPPFGSSTRGWLAGERGTVDGYIRWHERKRTELEPEPALRVRVGEPAAADDPAEEDLPPDDRGGPEPEPEPAAG